MKLKINGISGLTDARYCAGMGATYLAVELNPENGPLVDPNTLKAIQAWIEGVEWVGMVRGDDPKILEWAAGSFELSYWQISPEMYAALDPKKSAWNNSNLCLEINSMADYQLAQEAKIWAVEIPISLLPQIDFSSAQFLKFIGGCTDAKTIQSLFSKHPDWGFSLNSTLEEKPGWMDLSELQVILEELEELQ